MPLNLIFITPGDYTIEDNGIPGDNVSVIKDGSGVVIFTFVHPVDTLGFTVSTPGVNLTVNMTDSLGAADLTIGSLTDPAVTPDSITVKGVRTTGTVTLVANGPITEGGNDAGADIVAGQIVLSAQTGIGTGANAIETQAGAIEAETNTGGITLANFGSVQIGGISDQVDGLDVATSGDISVTNLGTILLSDETGVETVHGGASSGNVTLIANGFDSDIIATTNHDAINAPGGNIALQAGRDIGFGIIGTDFDNDVRARGGVTVNAGRDFLIDGFSDLASDDFGANTGGNVTITAGRNIHVRNVAGTDGSITAGGSSGADVILTTGAGGALVLDAPTSGSVSSLGGDVVVNADRILIAATSGIAASNGAVILRSATTGREIILGSAGDAALAVELSDAELGRIFTPNLTVGSDNGGNLTVISAITPVNAGNLTLRSHEDITVLAGITAAQSVRLIAGNNVFHQGGTINTSSFAAYVDSNLLGNDGGIGGYGLLLGSIVATSTVLNGASDADILRGAEGVEQVVHGYEGNDTITSSGEGTYFGDAGNDTVLAGLSSGLVDEVLDGGLGIDTLDTRSFTGDYIIDLAAGTSNFDYESFVNFENMVSGDGNDRIIGTSGANVIQAGNGNDIVAGGAGGDVLDGGADSDTVSYAGSSLGVFVRLFNNTAFGGDAGGDTIVGFENAAGSSQNDDLIGSVGSNVLDGAAGNDIVRGLAGADTLIGGSGVDTLSYAGSTLGVFVRLFNNTAFGGDASGDTISEFENAVGSSQNDDLIGSAGANMLDGAAGTDSVQGLDGNDTIGGGAGADTLDGGGGLDTLSYVGSSLGVFVRLFSSTAFGGDAAGDTIVGFENATGSSQNDDLIGSTASNLLDGGAGIDRVQGLDGNDTLIGGAGGDTLDGGAGIDTLSYAGSSLGVFVRLFNNTTFGGDANGDTISGLEYVTGSSQNDDLIGSADTNLLEGGAGNDSIQGLDGNDTISGGAGGDTLNGGNGIDTLSYAGSSAGVFVRLFNNTAFGGDASGDTISGFESVLGSSQSDDLIGSTGSDVLNGALGNDALQGLAGADAFRFTSAPGVGNVDTISDYVVADDTIQLENAMFAGLTAGVLAAGAFRTGAAAGDSDDRIIYNSATGALLFDADGNGAGAAVQFAALTAGLAMAASEFVVI